MNYVTTMTAIAVFGVGTMLLTPTILTKQVEPDTFKATHRIACNEYGKLSTYKATNVVIGSNTLNFVSVDTGMQQITMIQTPCKVIKLL